MSEPHDVASTRDSALLESVRALERRRIEAIRKNNVEEMSAILDDKFIYIDADGNLYDKEKYLRFVGSHHLTYSMDVELTETDHRIDGDLIIIVGQMLGHARLGGEPQVFHLRNMRVWRRRETGWRLLAWQSSTIVRVPTWSSDLPDWPM
jgi:hypothetical protein